MKKLYRQALSAWVIITLSQLWSGNSLANLAPTVQPLAAESEPQVDPGDKVRVRANVADPEGARLRMPGEPGPYRLFLYAYDGAATANVLLRAKGEVHTPLPFYVYEDSFEGMPWVPSGWMGAIDSLALDGDHADNPHAGKACIKLRYTGESGSWVGVAWQHPANNWGEMDGGHDLTGASQLELWARGDYGGEQIKIGVGLLGEDKAYPDSGKTDMEDIVLTRTWQHYRIALKNIDLASIKTGFVVTLTGQRTSVNVYLDSIRFVK